MASGRFLLDTNIIIALLNGDDAVISNLDEASEVFIPAVALGELFFGAARSSRPSENIDRVERFASGRAIVLCDLDVAREYGLLKQRLKEKGRPLSENDIWIAAAAKRYGLTLVTRDSHFRKLKTCSAWIGLSSVRRPYRFFLCGERSVLIRRDMRKAAEWSAAWLMLDNIPWGGDGK